MKQFGIIGAGNMATAIVRGLINSGAMPASEMMAFHISANKKQEFADYGVAIAASEEEIIAGCRYVLLSVKPQVFPQVLEKIAPFVQAENIFISIAAGITSDFVKSYLGAQAKVVLAMPNTPMLVGCGAAALARVDPVTQAEFDAVCAIFNASAITCQIPAEKMSEVIPLHGSSPALFYLVVKTLVEDAVARGFDYETANRLACQTMIGSAKMILENDLSHQQLIDMVCSKGGTTIAMLEEMERNGMTKAMRAGFDASIKRAYELGK